MDTPGFDAEKETEAFLEIVRGIRAIRPFARIIGLLYLNCIHQSRFDDFDRKLLKFTRSLCGDEYIPRVTFVSTFWTATGEKQKARFNNQLELLQRYWQEEMDEQPKFYNHGREYDTEGLDTERFLNWYEEDRAQIAEHGKCMIARNYGGATLPESPVVDLKIVEELKANTPVHLTDAGKFLGLPSASASNAPENASRERPDPDSSQQSSAPDDAPQRGPETTGPSGWGTFLNGVGSFFGRTLENVQFRVDIGAPNTAAPGYAQQFHSTRPPYAGSFGEC